MASSKRFSSFIVSTLILFVGVSLTLAIGSIYVVLSRSMTLDFSNKLEIQEKEVSRALADRLNFLEMQLREMSLNNAVRVNLMLGLKNQASELIQRDYPSSDGAFFLIKEKGSSIMIPELPENYKGLEPDLAQSDQEKDMQKILFKHTKGNHYLSLFSLPIKRKDDLLGTAYLLHDISSDMYLWKRVPVKADNKLLIMGMDNFVDLRTGRVDSSFKEAKNRRSKGFYIPWIKLYPRESIVPLKKFPGLFYAASTIPLQKKKTYLILALVFSFALIFVLTILISLAIAREVSKPLENMADQALNIAQGLSNHPLHEEKFEYVEYRKLARAFNSVFASFLNTQEDLRGRAKELDVSEKRYRSLVETSPTGILIMDMDWNILFANNTIKKITGYSEASLVTMKFMDLTHPDVRHELRLIEDYSLSKDTQKMWQGYWMHKDGRSIWVEINAIKIEEHTEDVVLLNVMDITKRKKAEGEKKELETMLRQAQKMEAIGTLAGGIAHDFNNILFPITGYTELAMNELEEDSPVRTKLSEVLKAAELAKGLVQQILTFSRSSENKHKPLRIQSIIKESLKFLRSSLPSTIEIRQKIDNNSGPVMADPTQIYQVMMNLCTNAYHAMRKKGGVLGLALTEETLRPQDINSGLNLTPGKYIKISVSDTGHGMDPLVLGRIFDPYFTTKGPGEGTGMGLSVVHGIITNHGGDISVKSRPGKGSVFHIYLPRIKTDDTRPKSVSTASTPKGKENVLLVDDEEQIIQMLTEMLEQLGYHVTARTSSVEALEVFRVRSDQFDLVITDQTMPNMTGTELAQRLMAIKPAIPVILCTGFSEVISEEKARFLGIREYVMKPVVISELARTIRKALD